MWCMVYGKKSEKYICIKCVIYNRYILFQLHAINEVVIYRLDRQISTFGIKPLTISPSEWLNLLVHQYIQELGHTMI